jgi:hypothetical protein
MKKRTKKFKIDMKRKLRRVILSDLDKMLSLSFTYCKFEENDRIRDIARKINNEAYELRKYVRRYIKEK